MPGNFFTMPGIDEQIGPALQSLTNSVMSIKDSKFMVRQALNEALDKDFDGSLHQALIDKGPEFLKQIYGKKTAERYGKGKISNEEQIRRDDAAALAALTPEQRADRNAERFKYRTPEAKKSDVAGARKVTSDANVAEGTEIPQITTAGATARSAVAGANVAEATAKDQISTFHNKAEASDMEMNDLRAIFKANPNLADIDTSEMVTTMARGGQVDPMKWARLPQAAQAAVTQAAGNLHDITMQTMQFGNQVELQKLKNSSHEVKSQILVGMNQQVDNLTGQYKALDEGAKKFLESHIYLGTDLMKKDKTKIPPDRLADIEQFNALKGQRDALLPQITEWTDRSGQFLLEMAGKEAGGAIRDTTLISDPKTREAVDHFKSLSPRDAKIEWEHLKLTNPEAASKLAPLIGMKETASAPATRTRYGAPLPNADRDHGYTGRLGQDTSVARGIKVDGQEDLINALDAEAKKQGFTYTVISGTRTPERNRAVGGKTDSLHLGGQALDIKTNNRKALDAFMVKQGYVPGSTFKTPDPNHYSLKSVMRNQSRNSFSNK